MSHSEEHVQFFLVKMNLVSLVRKYFMKYKLCKFDSQQGRDF